VKRSEGSEQGATDITEILQEVLDIATDQKNGRCGRLPLPIIHGKKGRSLQRDAIFRRPLRRSVEETERACRMTIQLSLSAVLLLLLPIFGVAAQSRPAKCLLEVKGIHYLGGPCVFTPLDKFGSFRITDAPGLNLIAQVIAHKKDEGTAVWNGPLGGNAPAKDLGDVYRSGGCWTASDSDPDKYNDSRICAWSLKEKVYLSPSPKEPSPSDVLYYGSRVGMYDEITRRQGIDTSDAQIETKPSKDGAVTFCREYGRDYSQKCVDEQMRGSRPSVVRGNCLDKTFTDFNGNRYAFLGRTQNEKTEITAEFSIRDLSTRDILDGSSASGYDVRLEIYQALCPSSAPKRQN
jgi:hypothetical protein